MTTLTPSQFSIPGPFPVSTNLCTFQKSSGVVPADCQGCEAPCLTPADAAAQAQSLFQSLDDVTIWTAQAAIVSSCDECIYGPVDLTLREFVANLKSVCCLDDSCLVGIINAILCNPVLNYRARFIEFQQQVQAINQQNAIVSSSFAQSSAAAAATNQQICQIVTAVKGAIATVNQAGNPGDIACCLAQCLQNLCPVSAPPPPTPLPLPCPCPPIDDQALANACVVIKVRCLPCAVVSSPPPKNCFPACLDNIDCNGSSVGSGNVTIGGVTVSSQCLLPTGAPFVPQNGSHCTQGERCAILTFKHATHVVTGNGVF